jgi:imidazolonepropionase-like amidohydrolase
MMLINELISHASRRQATIILFSCEIECMIMTESVKKVIWCARFLIELNFREYNTLVILHADNRDAIDLTVNLQFHKRTKHIEIRWHWIREMIERKLIKINYLSIKKLLTNDLIKSLTESTFDVFRKLLNMKIWITTIITTASISTICLDKSVLEYSRHD